MPMKKLENTDLYYLPNSPQFPVVPELEWRA